MCLYLMFTDKERAHQPPPCDYTNGDWVPDKKGPLYNGTTCGTIKEGQNCISHGRPDFDYLYWRGDQTSVSFHGLILTNFFNCLGRNVWLSLVIRWLGTTFVGDSMARN